MRLQYSSNGVGLICLGCCLAAAAAPAGADTPRYRAIELYTLQLPPTGGGRSLSSGAAVGGQVVGFGDASTPHAFLWGVPSGTGIDLHPTRLTGFSRSSAAATDGPQQVGEAWDALSDSNGHAILWNGTADSAVELHPTNLGFRHSAAVAIWGNQEVGYGDSSTSEHALLWTGTAASVVDLHPSLPGILDSRALGTDGVHQVGFGSPGGMGHQHALLWAGTANSVIDLNPTQLTGLTASETNGVWQNQQVGFGMFPDGGHAMLWNGTADSAVDLNPTHLPAFSESLAIATNGRQQVGYGSGPGFATQEALLWNGTADSAVNLHALLPSGYSGSEAFSIDAAGDVFGTAETVGTWAAIEWVPIPEPAAMGSVGALVFLPRRRRRRAGI